MHRSVLVASCLAASALITQPSPTQAQRAWSVGVRSGVGFAQTKDRVVSPLVYRGVRVPLFATFLYEHGRNRHRAALGIDVSPQWNRFDHAALFLGHRAEYVYARALGWPKTRGWTLFVGGGVRGRMDPAVYLDFSTDYLYWLTTYDLLGHAVLSGGLGRRKALTFALQVPLVGLVSRPPAQRFDVGDTNFGSIYRDTHHDFDVATFGRYWSFELRTCFRHAGRGPGSRELCYHIRYDRYRDPRPITIADHVIDYTFWF